MALWCSKALGEKTFLLTNLSWDKKSQPVSPNHLITHFVKKCSKEQPYNFPLRSGAHSDFCAFFPGNFAPKIKKKLTLLSVWTSFGVSILHFWKIYQPFSPNHLTTNKKMIKKPTHFNPYNNFHIIWLPLCPSAWPDLRCWWWW